MVDLRALALPDMPSQESELAVAAEGEGHLDAICRIAAALFGTPFAIIVSHEGGRRQLIGDADLTPDRPRNDVVVPEWASTENAAGAFVILDTRRDPRFAPSIREKGKTGIRFLARAFVGAQRGEGSTFLYIADAKPRASFNSEQIRQLNDIASMIGAELSLKALRDFAGPDALDKTYRHSEAQYRVLADALPYLVAIICATTGETIYVNQKFAEYRGSAATSRRKKESLIHPDDSVIVSLARNNTQATQGQYEVAARLRRWDGQFRWHKLVAVPILAEGRVAATFEISFDIDESMTARRDLERAMDRLRLTHAAAAVGEYAWELPTGLISLSPTSARLHGLPVPVDAGDAPIVVTMAQLKACILPADLPRVRRSIKRTEAGRAKTIIQYRTRVLDALGSHRWIESHGCLIADEAGRESCRFVGLHFDVTDRHRVEEALRDSQEHLRRSEERLALALDSGGDGLFDWNLVTGSLWTSKSWLSKLGYADDESAGAGPFFLATVHHDDRPAVQAQLDAHLSGREPNLQAEYRYLRADGGSIWVLNRASVAARDEQGRPLRLVGTLIDISRWKEAEMHIAHLAHHDALTDLPNRTLFRQHLDRVLKRSEQGRDPFAVLACDLDGFKTVNDTLGHHIGDAVLRIVACRLSAVVRANDTVSRQGGDEFAIILNDIDGEASVGIVCTRIIAAIDKPIQVDGFSIDITISIGVVLVSGGEITAEDLLTRADTALYQAKALGRNTFSLFEATAHARSATRNMLAMDMREAIRRGDFFLVYQPVIDVGSNAVTSFEALMRWRHPVHGLISPGDFIPVAEDTGMIVPLGAWALQEACREAMTWPEDVRVGVNVSPVQFRGGLEQHVMTALVNAALPARRLKLEVTESVLMRDADDALACLHRLRDLGVRIALDDFGTGYSSLSYLRRFPFDKLKIDRTFIRDIADPDAAAIVRAVAGLGERLGMVIVAEGVETEEQLALVRREGCTEVQGFLFSKPLPADEARAFLRLRPSEQDAA